MLNTEFTNNQAEELKNTKLDEPDPIANEEENKQIVSFLTTMI